MASSPAPFSSNNMLKKFVSLRISDEGFCGRNQGSTSGSVRGQAANHYEPRSHHYEHLVEGQFWTPTYPILNPYISGEECSSRYFRRKSNPLFLKCADDDQPKNHCLRRSRKYGFLAIIVCILIALSVTLTCWIYELNHGNEMEHLRRKMDSMKNSSLQIEVVLRSLKNQTLDYRRCQYRTKERGNSNQIEYTLTDFVPETNDAKNGIVTGVNCVVEGGTTAVLKFTGMQYFCNCTGKSHGDSRFCKIHYWYCPKTIQE